MGGETRRRANIRPAVRSIPRGLRAIPVVAAVLLLGALSGGCRNACQSTCVQLAEFSRECGIAVPDEQIDACFEAQRDVSPEDRESCRSYGGAQALDDTLSCQDLDLLWGDQAAGVGS